MPHEALRFGTAALAAWRVTHLLAREDGPGDVVLRGRAALGTSWVGGLMDCFDCMSLWVAAPFAPLAVRGTTRDRVACWLALSGAACLLDRAAQGGATTIEEVDDGLLWEGARGAPGVDAAGAAAPGPGPVGWEAAATSPAHDRDPGAAGVRAGAGRPTGTAAAGPGPLRSGA
jgi:hypothetical protein